MLPARLRKAAYALVVLQGLFSVFAPRIASKLGLRMGLLGFDNTDALEAQDWYLRAVRATGVGMVAAGGTALLLESRAEPADADDPDGAADDGDGTGPVELDV
ncbi:MAG: hypothetical protein ABEH56_04900 [Salinirussus sp.]